MDRQVWITAWQMQCCGNRFGVGQNVVWTTLTNKPDSDDDAYGTDDDYLSLVLGKEAASAITDYEEHHPVEEDCLETVTGIVTGIKAVSCEFAPRGDGMFYPVPGTVVFTDRQGADGWEHEAEPLQFVGYVVRLRQTTPTP